MSFPSIKNQNMESLSSSSSSSSSLGYRFRPSNSILFQQFLLPKVTNGYYQPGIIHDLDVYGYQPWDLPGMNMEECEAYYFTPRSRKYPNGSRPNRIVTDHNQDAEPKGFWKMSSSIDIRGEDETLFGKKNLLNYFHASNVKTEWKMHEFVLDASQLPPNSDGNSVVLEDVVLCRIYTTARDNRSKLRGQSRTQMSQISSTAAPSEQQPLKRKQPAACSSSYYKEQEPCNKRVTAAASTTPVDQEQPSAGHPIITQVRRQVSLTVEPLTELQPLPSSYDQIEQSNMRSLAAASVTPVEQQQPSFCHPIITQVRRQVSLAVEPLTQLQPLPSSYDQREQSNMGALAGASTTPVEQQQPSFCNPVPALITQVRRQAPLAVKSPIQLSLHSYYDQQETRNYMQALTAASAVTPVQQPSADQPLTTAEPLPQLVGELQSPLVRAELELRIIEALSQQLLSDHDDLDYSDILSDISLYHRYKYIYNQFKALI